MAFWRLHYHLVWATHQRSPLLTDAVEPLVNGTILSKAQELGVVIHAIGNVNDHIHVAASIPPKVALADCVRHFKGASSRHVNVHREGDVLFKWQEGYGALSFGDRALADVMAYVKNQKEHHRRGSLRSHFERMSEEDDGVQLTPFEAQGERDYSQGGENGGESSSFGGD
jgi:REP element-mobilizing transposase RayT